MIFARSGLPEHGAAVGHDGPVRGSRVRAEGVRRARRFAFQGPGQPRDQQGVGAGHAGQTARRPGQTRGRRASVQACGHRAAALLQFSGESSVLFFYSRIIYWLIFILMTVFNVIITVIMTGDL